MYMFMSLLFVAWTRQRKLVWYQSQSAKGVDLKVHTRFIDIAASPWLSDAAISGTEQAVKYDELDESDIAPSAPQRCMMTAVQWPCPLPSGSANWLLEQ